MAKPCPFYGELSSASDVSLPDWLQPIDSASCWSRRREDMRAGPEGPALPVPPGGGTAPPAGRRARRQPGAKEHIAGYGLRRPFWYTISTIISFEEGKSRAVWTL